MAQQVSALTNAFELKWAPRPGVSGHVYHYDVAMTPTWALRDADKFKIGSRKATEIMMRLQEQIAPQVFSPQGAFDGSKNLYSFASYNFPSQEFRVPMKSDNSRGRSDRQPKIVSVKIVFVRHINISALSTLLHGHASVDNEAANALNMLNVFVQATPRMQDPRLHNARSFFVPLGKASNPKIQPLELWRGFFQSVRPSFNRIIVNVDVTVGTVMPAMSLEKVCADYLHLRDARGLSDLSPANFQKLRLFVKGLKAEVMLPNHQGRNRPIKDLVKDVGAQTFDKDGISITVADHFRRVHNTPIRPNSLGVRIGQDGLFPITVCRTVQQLMKHKSSPEVVREALDFTPPNPHLRLQSIQAGWQNLHYGDSPFLSGAGITVEPTPITVHGRTIPSPRLTFGQDYSHSLQRPGVWDVMRKHLIHPVSIRSWTVVDFAACDPSILNTFLQDFTSAMKALGITVGEPHAVVRHSGHVEVSRTLYQAGAEARAALILVILPEQAAPLYREVKRFGDITQGCATQCIKWSTKLAKDARDRHCNQYHNNVILKINARLGGTNYVPSTRVMDILREVPTMVLGADVSHPGPGTGSGLPSIAALTSSYDRQMSKYVASIRVQSSRVEMIEDIQDMFYHGLETFKVKNNVYPQRIFYLRDGVSEGEFGTVMDREISAMGVVIRKIYASQNPPQEPPKLACIVVGKRHRFRFFPNGTADPKGNGNLYAGFTVDNDIVHPSFPNFYLQSQPGLKGTSRPSHYTVLRNTTGLSFTDLQEISYALCHCYSRATRSVKIPAPIYYADLVCRRAKFHFDDQVAFSDTMSATSEEDTHLDFYREHFGKINDRIKDLMYFV